MKINRKKNSIIGIVGLFISLILIVRFSLIVGFLIDFSKSISRDNSFNPNTVIEIKILFIFFILFMTILSMIIILDLKRNIIQYFNTYFQTDQAKKIFLVDDICSKKQLPLYILIIGTLFGILMHLYLLILGEPSFEGTMEKSSSLLFLFSAIILIISITRIKKGLVPSRNWGKIIFSIIIISGILLLIFGEEISWGQRIFGWESSSVFTEHNYQNEINVHNFFNPIFKYIYPIVGMGSFIVLFFMWIFPKKRKSYYFKLFFPHPSLFFLIFIMACSSFSSAGEEIYEQLFAIFVLLYSFRLFMCLSFPKIGLSNL